LANTTRTSTGTAATQPHHLEITAIGKRFGLRRLLQDAAGRVGLVYAGFCIVPIGDRH
jgi:hypothetical protein